MINEKNEKELNDNQKQLDNINNGNRKESQGKYNYINIFKRIDSTKENE